VPTTYALKTDATNAANTVYSNNAAGYLTTVPMTATNQFILTNGNGSGLTSLKAMALTSSLSHVPAMAVNSGYPINFTNNTSVLLEVYFVAMSTGGNFYYMKNGVALTSIVNPSFYMQLWPGGYCSTGTNSGGGGFIDTNSAW
jgi:hypothetical protein